MHSTPRFLQGIFPFEGQGVDKPVPVHDSLTYTVPMGITTQPLYFRGGNSTDELVTVVLLRDGAPMRYFSGDQGARSYLSSHPPVLCECGDLATGRDLDRPEDLPHR